MFAPRLRHGLSVLALAALASACTFPSVDYADDDAGPAGAMCTVTGTCAETAQRCGEDAYREQMACLQRCNSKPGPTCTSDCDGALAATLTGCTAACESCGEQQGCASGAASCKALVGS